MERPALEQLKTFHEHLVALDGAGVSLDVGKRQQSVSAILDQALARLRVRVDLGQSLEEALQSEKELPARYRCAALTRLSSASSDQALDAMKQSVGEPRELRRSLLAAMVLPAFIGGLVYLGTISLCLYTAPRFEAVYQQLRQPPSFSLLVLRFLREWLPVWGPLAPVLLLIAVWFVCRADWHRLLAWAPVMKGFLRTSNRALLADQLARLSENHLPLSGAVPVAQERGLRLDSHGGLDSPDPAVEKSTTKAAATRKVESLPPLLQWSLAERGSPEQLADNLRTTAATYKRAAQRQERFWRVVGPTVATLVVGGGIMLAYGCALFAPFTALMQDLSSATGYVEIQTGPLAPREGDPS